MNQIIKGFLGHLESAPIKVTVIDYPVDRVVKVRDPKRRDSPPGRKGAPVLSLSSSSRRRMAFTARNFAEGMRFFVTLTYPGNFALVPRSGTVVKRHLNVWLTALRRRVPGVRYFWFMEFQGRGAVHLHVFADTLGFDHLAIRTARTRLAREWSRIVFGDVDRWAHPSCDLDREFLERERAKHRKAGTSLDEVVYPHAPESYAAKEAGKMAQKVVPPWFQSAGRFWGVSRGFRMTEPIERVATFSQDERALAVALVDEFEGQRIESWAAVEVEAQPHPPEMLRGGRIRSGASIPFGRIARSIFDCQEGEGS